VPLDGIGEDLHGVDFIMGGDLECHVDTSGGGGGGFASTRPRRPAGTPRVDFLAILERLGKFMGHLVHRCLPSVHT
jgi:hypothetical protein